VTHPYFAIPIPIVIGHRGCAGECPENTLPSFERALAAGAAILETDLHVSRDGVPVLIHDPVVDRVCDGSGRVSDLSLAELQRLDAGHHFTLDGGRSHPFRGKGFRIPTFEEALKNFPGARFNVEIKADGPGCVEAAVNVVARNHRESLTLLTAGDDAIMQRLRSHLEQKRIPVAQGASVADIVAVLRSAADASAPDTASMALQIPREFGGRPLVTPELIEHAHAHHIQIHVWTINDADEMDDLLALGVDGIVSDFPELLAQRIARRCADTGG
jgi:glycerophosphoryl diester phosphodiesterase